MRYKRINFLLFVNLIFIIMFGKKTSKAGVMPLRNQSVEEWQKWAEKANWKKVYEAFQDFMPRGYAPYKDHDQQVLDVLRKHLFTIKFPICRVSENINHLEVPNGIGVDNLKDLVNDTERDYPYLIVEKSGRYRGIALSQNLIFAGVCWIPAMPKEVIRKAKELKLEFLTREDSKLMEQHFNEIDELLKAVGAPTVSDLSSWMVAPVAAHAPYVVWQLSRRDRKGEIGETTPTYLLVKL